MSKKTSLHKIDSFSLKPTMNPESEHIRSTFKSAFIYSGASIMGKAVGFIMLPVYAHYLRGEGYGIISMIDVVLSMLGMLIGYGISGAMRRFYFQKETVLQKNVFISTNVSLMFLLVVVVTLPSLLFAEPIAALVFGKEGLGYYLVLGMFAFMADTTSRNAENYILIRQQAILFSLISLSRLVVGLSLNIYFIVILHMGVLGFLYSNLITAALFTVITHGYVFCLTGLHFDKSDAKDILRFSLPLLPGYIAMFFRLKTDRIVMMKYLGLAQLGAYEMVLKFVSLLVVLITDPFMKSWDVKRMEVCEREEGPGYMSKMFTYHMAISFFIGLILALETPLILKLLTPEEFWLGSEIVVLAVLSRLFMDSYYHFFFGLVYAKVTYKVSVIQFSTALFNVLLNILLIKYWGIIGAVLTSTVVNGLQAFLAYFIARKYYKIPFEWGKLASMSCIGLVMYLAINQVYLEGTGAGSWLIMVAEGPLTLLLCILHLDTFMDGKFAMYVTNHIPLMFESLIKLLSACLFIVILPMFGILPKKISLRTDPALMPS